MIFADSEYEFDPHHLEARGLVYWQRMGTGFRDSSLYGLTATTDGGIVSQPGATINGRLAQSFDGTDDALQLGSPRPFLTGWTEGTWSAWVYNTRGSSGDEDTIMSSWHGSSANRHVLIRFDSNSNQIDFFVQTSPSGQTSIINTFDLDSAWNHVGCRWRGGALSTWVNGVKQGTTGSLSGTMSTSVDSQFAIGASYHQVANARHDEWSGYIADARVYNWGLPDDLMRMISSPASLGPLRRKRRAYMAVEGGEGGGGGTILPFMMQLAG